MEFNYNVKELYKQAFGAFPKSFPKASVDLAKLAGSHAASFLGTPMPMTLLLNYIPLPHEPLITVTGSKNIVKTQIAGRSGTVKELVSRDDYRVTIKGMLVNLDTPESYPVEEVKGLQTICEIEGSIKVENLLLRIFNITQIVIESYEFPEMEGFPGAQPYTIHAISDDDPELVLIDDIAGKI